MTSLKKLSANDKAVLNSILNPNLPLGEKEQDEVAAIKFDDDRSSNEIVARLEIQAVAEAEKGEYTNSLETMRAALELEPNRAALYNNRAQLYMLMGNMENAMRDLNKAIDLCNSQKKCRTLALALCQRGVIHKRLGNEASAKEDFHSAAQMGNSFAKQQLVEMNPYAALCNQMLSEVMKKCTN